MTAAFLDSLRDVVVKVTLLMQFANDVEILIVMQNIVDIENRCAGHALHHCEFVLELQLVLRWLSEPQLTYNFDCALDVNLTIFCLLYYGVVGANFNILTNFVEMWDVLDPHQALDHIVLEVGQLHVLTDLLIHLTDIAAQLVEHWLLIRTLHVFTLLKFLFLLIVHLFGQSEIVVILLIIFEVV